MHKTGLSRQLAIIGTDALLMFIHNMFPIGVLWQYHGRESISSTFSILSKERKES